MTLLLKSTAVLLMSCSIWAGSAYAQHRQSVSFRANTLIEADTTVQGDLTLPAGQSDAKFPAVVVIHSSGGYEDPTRKPYVQALHKAGIATLELNLFSRGNRPKNSRMNLPHTFGALNYLAQDSRIDANRIGILGLSHGGLLALFSSSKEENATYSGGKHKFAAHLALYPVCWAHLASAEGKNPVYPKSVYTALTGAPVHILAGEKDVYDAPDSCQKFIAALPDEARTHVHMTLYANATHGWDSPEEKSYQDPAANMGRGAYVRHLRNPAVTAQSLDFSQQFFSRAFAEK